MSEETPQPPADAPALTQPAARALQKLEQAADRLDFYGRIDSVAVTLLQCIDEVRSGHMRPSQGTAVAQLCATLIKALEVARGNTPAVSITAQLNRDEIEEILHGRDPFRPTVTVSAEPVQGGGAREPSDRPIGTPSPSDSPEG